MTQRRRLIDQLVDVVGDVNSSGPDHAAFDGLRVLQHPTRLYEWLVGRWHQIVPVTVEVWPSLSCNARCPSCPYRRSGARLKADASDQLMAVTPRMAQRLPTALARSGVRSVMITGGGEPLLSPDLLTYVDSIRRAGLAWGIFTNGERLSTRVAAALAANEPRWIRVSLDAGTSGVHRSIYGDGIDFDTVLTNIVDVGRQLAANERRNPFGVSFALPWWFTDEHLRDSAELTAYLVEESHRGLASVAIRPRAAQFSSGSTGGQEANIPIPHGREIQSLGLRAAAVFGEALQRFGTVRLDVKQSLFAAAGDAEPAGGAGAGWLTVVDHAGEGYLVSELAGAHHAWGEVVDDFAAAWASDRRIDGMRQIFDGDLQMPPVHRLSPVDAMLGLFRALLDGIWLTQVEAATLLDRVTHTDFYRSASYDFV